MGQALEDGEDGDNYVPVNDADVVAEHRRRNEGLWTGDDEEFYNEGAATYLYAKLTPDQAPNQRNWHYPANFEGTAGDSRMPKKKGVLSGSRWDRTRNSSTVGDADNGAYPPSSEYNGHVAANEDVPEWGKDYGSKSRKKSKGSLKKSKNDWADQGAYVGDVEREDRWNNATPTAGRENGAGAGGARNGRNGDVNWDHEF